MVQLIKLDYTNSRNYIGKTVLYYSRNTSKTSIINNISPSGKTIYINNSDVNNCLEIMTRNVYVII
jgi:hypothetical protein